MYTSLLSPAPHRAYVPMRCGVCVREMCLPRALIPEAHLPVGRAVALMCGNRGLDHLVLFSLFSEFV